jgi:hypothetical protein
MYAIKQSSHTGQREDDDGCGHLMAINELAILATLAA